MIIEQLHNLYPNLADLRMREIRVDKQQRKVFCVLSYPASEDFNNAIKSQIVEFIKNTIPKGYYCNVKFAEDNFTLISFTRNLTDLIKEHFPIYANIGKHQIETHIADKQIDVVFNVGGVTKKNMEMSEFCEKLSEFYNDYTSYKVSFGLREDAQQKTAAVEEQEKLVQLAINRELLKPSRFFRVSGQKALFGKEIVAMPMYIADLRKPLDNCTVCGVVSAKSCRKAKNNPLLYVCSFTLTDGTGESLPCVLFVRLQITDVETIMSETGRGEAEARTLAEKRILSNDKKLKDILWLSDGMSAVVRGKACYGQNGQLELHVYDLCSCKIYPIARNSEFKRPVADEYLLVKPEDCAEYRQINFVDQTYGKSLLDDKDYVVLHANGISFGNITEGKIYAICGVKLRNGHITQKFFTYVNPETEITDERTLEQCQTASSKLIFYPTLTEIISDLYKFVYGSRLVGNNLQQIVQLLDYYAAPMDYKFSNELVNQTDLIRDLFDNSILDASVNAAKLEDVAKKCKIPCRNLVFCSETALTVARCMAMLSDNSK